MKNLRGRGWTLLLTLVLLAGGGYALWSEYDRIRGLRDYAEAAQIADVAERAAPPGKESLTEQERYAAALSGTDLDALREVNGEVTAWIDIPGTGLAYPVLQAADNEYYLNRTWMGERSAVGAVFMECRCAADFSGFHTIVYAHRMRDDSMFGILKYYKDQEFWQEHPDIYLVTDEGVCRYEIFSAQEAGVTGIVYRLDLQENGMEEEFLKDCVENSVIDTGIVPEAGSRILTLSTCTGSGYAARWTVHGVLAEVYQPAETSLPENTE